MTRTLAALLSVLAFITSTSTSTGQTPLLPSAEPVAGTLGAGGSQSWPFVARDGGMLSLHVEATDGTLDPVLRIEGPNGDTLLSNDDAHYPQSRAALIEGFMPPVNGTYTAIVSGYGNTSGAYTLSLTPGYANVAHHEQFDAAAGWRAHDDASITPDSGTLTLALDGVSRFDVATAPTATTPADFYASAAVRSIRSAGSGWYAGLALRHQADGRYYELLLNHNGAWRFSRVDGDERRILRDWTLHPAIAPGATNFTLAALVRGDGFEFFYDHQYIGEATDATLSGSGDLGLLVGTANAIGARTSVTYGDLLITTPQRLAGDVVFPQQIMQHRSPNAAMRELRRRHVIPHGGQMVLTMATSSAQNTTAGVSRFPIASDTVFGDLVFGATLNGSPPDAGQNGCGLVLHDREQVYSLAYVDSTGGYGLAQYVETGFRDNLYVDDGATDGPYQLIVVALGRIMHLFVNGRYIGQQNTLTTSGGIGEAVINFDPGMTQCQFEDLWVWRWD